MLGNLPQRYENGDFAVIPMGKDDLLVNEI